jgi:hypothetical protein
MKRKISLLFILSFFTVYGAISQDTVKVKVLGKNLVTVVEGGAKTDVTIGDSTIDIRDDSEDTVKIRVGRKALVIAEGNKGTDISFDQLDDQEFESWTGHPAKFKGHWAIFEMGVNSFTNVSYDGYETKNFMDVNHNKSYEVNINLLKYSIGLQKVKRNIGVVTGLGLNFNDYRFTNNYTIENVDGYIQPVELDENVQKTKLSTFYLTIPLLLEFQIPVNDQSKKVYLSGGLIGGIKMSSHTKVKINDVKTHDKNDFNINPFRYGATARIGYKGVNLFATYYFTELFQGGRGPVMNPFSIGIGILNW